ncbi:MAG: hypothetical protein M1827_007227 [Pycnora praestabilis]|nr:MAG: hypothetical protein M1827_007227 [Pycnora praestabilis]
MDPPAKNTYAGQATYTPFALQLYDFIVVNISSTWIWQCPSSYLVGLYNRHLSGNHLDIGVGTGYFLDAAEFPTKDPRIVLFDLNTHTLEHTERRIARYAPKSYKVDVLNDRPDEDIEKFDSVGINYLLHCLPGAGFGEKAVVFDFCKSMMKDDATLFGSTILGKGVPRSWLAVKLMGVYNWKGIFDNEKDSLEDLKRELEGRWREVGIEVKGCVAMFSATSR